MKNIGTHNFIQQTRLDIKVQIDANTVRVCNLNTPLSPIYRTSRPKKVIKEASELNGNVDQVDFTDSKRYVTQQLSGIYSSQKFMELS
jgi:hypothetical protein